MSDPQVLVWLLIEQDGAALLGLRKSDRPPFAGTWSLPGDLMSDTESATETATRFAGDQLGISLTSEEFVDTLTLVEGDKQYAVNIFRTGYDGHPRFRESGPYSEVRWVTAADVEDTSMKMPEALRRSLRLALGRSTH